jgi:hypothetical protein
MQIKYHHCSRTSDIGEKEKIIFQMTNPTILSVLIGSTANPYFQSSQISFIWLTLFNYLSDDSVSSVTQLRMLPYLTHRYNISHYESAISQFPSDNQQLPKYCLEKALDLAIEGSILFDYIVLVGTVLKLNDNHDSLSERRTILAIDIESMCKRELLN